MQPSMFDVLWQAGVHDIKAQLNGAGNLVHILPTWPLCSDGAQFNFCVGNAATVHVPD
jgi:hypothetical protein